MKAFPSTPTFHQVPLGGNVSQFVYHCPRWFPFMLSVTQEVACASLYITGSTAAIERHSGKHKKHADRPNMVNQSCKCIICLRTALGASVHTLDRTLEKSGTPVMGR